MRYLLFALRLEQLRRLRFLTLLLAAVLFFALPAQARGWHHGNCARCAQPLAAAKCGVAPVKLTRCQRKALRLQQCGQPTLAQAIATANAKAAIAPCACGPVRLTVPKLDACGKQKLDKCGNPKLKLARQCVPSNEVDPTAPVILNSKEDQANWP